MFIEDQIEADFDQYAALAVPIGGVGAYPTMVAETTNLPWLVDTIAHEWIHNYLTQRPLGIRYSVSPEIRTMNETTANIAGKELGEAVLAKYFPQYLPSPVEEAEEETDQTTTEEPAPPAFDFRAEMHETRVEVDRLLADGQIEEAEAYMEARRIIFWENGYRIRKLNQAYFAFYGAYADQPGGASGEDPVGAAVRQLRAESDSLKTFLQQMAGLKTFADLESLLESD